MILTQEHADKLKSLIDEMVGSPLIEIGVGRASEEITTDDDSWVKHAPGKPTLVSVKVQD
jgi:hypothetical protein